MSRFRQDPKVIARLAEKAEELAGPATVPSGDSITVDGTATFNGTVNGIGGGLTLESTDSITVDVIQALQNSGSMTTLFNGSSATVLGGAYYAVEALDFTYSFADGNTVNLHGGTGYDKVGGAANTSIGGGFEVGYLPPAENVTKVEIGYTGRRIGAKLYRI